MVKRQDLSLDFKARRLFTCLMSVGSKKIKREADSFVQSYFFVAAELHASCSCGNAVAMMMMCGLMFSDVGLTYQVQNVVAMVG